MGLVADRANRDIGTWGATWRRGDALSQSEVSGRHRLGWIVLAIATVAFAVLPDLLSLPEPQDATVIDHAVYLSGDGTSQEVQLPHAIYPSPNRQFETQTYRIEFELQTVPDHALFLYIPTLNRRVSSTINGVTLFNGSSGAFWSGPLASTSNLAQLPRAALTVGDNRLTLSVDAGRFAVPFYISKIYIGGEASLEPSFRLRVLLGDQLKLVALAAHVLLGLGLICAYLFRPKDRLFFWLSIFLASNLVVAIGMFFGFQPSLRYALPYITAFVPVSGLLFIGVALAMIGKMPPRALSIASIVVLVVFVSISSLDTPFARTAVALGSGIIIEACLVAGTCVTAWGALRNRNVEARLMLAPTFLLTWFALRDGYVSATLPAHAFNLIIPYARPLYLVVVTVILMRRMGDSLDSLDRANETLAARLAEREAELAALHQRERAKTAQVVRESERQRLTHDLHDGISGHLASIIALSERAGVGPIEQAARDALSDLRLVIYSLDLGDRELPLAFANFRERLEPQLKRLGVELDWSTASLPEVSGVTPGNALAVLRIVQEAITNAIKHGPARSITIRGAAAPDGMVTITIENDGGPFVETKGGHGLANMRRRAQRLHGGVTIESIGRGTRVTLLLPAALPDFEDESAA